jgi:hypothetical protein
MLKELPELGKLTGRFGTDEEGTSHTFTTDKVDHKVRKVCGTCNRGWMGQLEDRVAPILRPTVLGNLTRLGLEDQRLVALWAAKTAMVLDVAAPDSGIIPEEHFDFLYRERHPPPHTLVWLAAYALDAGEPGEMVRAYGLYSRVVGLTWHVSTGDLNGYLSTFSAGYLVVQVMTLAVPDDYPPTEVGTVSDAPFVHVWPPVPRLLTWPPSVSVTLEGLEGLADGTGPAQIVFRPVTHDES